METRSVRFRSVPHWIVFLLAACGSSPAPSPVLPDVPPPPGRCADYRDGHRNVYYGDLHVHTRMSLDAYFFSGVNGPREAHRFARGEAVGLPAIGSDDPFTAGRERSSTRAARTGREPAPWPTSRAARHWSPMAMWWMRPARGRRWRPRGPRR